MIKLNSNTIFSVILALFFVVIINRIIPISVDPVMELVLSKNRTHITTIDQTRSISTVKRIMIDEVNLYDKNRFFHPALGKLGWDNDFWADITTPFTVKQDGLYLFLVGSDDGFSLTINDKPLCSFKGDRGYSKQTCRATLAKGSHLLKLSYFQGYGNAGLTLEFQGPDKKRPRFWGNDTKLLQLKQ
ncbi:PA14 domain-containing protein [Teredinibacter purpureus]|uniref:PA14 domain-containing protein n=1 Tax=Teredinibacter purpureus TaxID=2731756 RepID=UPI0005F8291D|nr:PA14 domain-containing protein [Teredinibacter purpureus]